VAKPKLSCQDIRGRKLSYSEQYKSYYLSSTAVNTENTTTTRVAATQCTDKLDSFAKEFSRELFKRGLNSLISLKDKSCLSGHEYVAPDIRVLFRMPTSIVNPDAADNTHLIESGWTFSKSDRSSEPESQKLGNAPMPVTVDTHVTKTRPGYDGTLVHFHVIQKTGKNAIDELEVSSVYTYKMWEVAEDENFLDLVMNQM
jgi:hypothetical protein